MQQTLNTSGNVQVVADNEAILQHEAAPAEPAELNMLLQGKQEVAKAVAERVSPLFPVLGKNELVPFSPVLSLLVLLSYLCSNSAASCCCLELSHVLAVMGSFDFSEAHSEQRRLEQSCWKLAPRPDSNRI